MTKSSNVDHTTKSDDSEPSATAPLIDGNAQRAQLISQAVLLTTAWLLDSWALVAATGLILGIGALRWPSWALFVQIHQRFVAPHLATVLPIDARPPRFSAALGGLTLPTLAIAIAVGYPTIGWALVLANAVAVTFEAAIGRCAPCELYVWAARRKLIRLATPLAATTSPRRSLTGKQRS